jgi:hypothetical protein
MKHLAGDGDPIVKPECNIRCAFHGNWIHAAGELWASAVGKVEESHLLGHDQLEGCGS